MKGVGWIADQSINIEQAKKAGELISEVSLLILLKYYAVEAL